MSAAWSDSIRQISLRAWARNRERVEVLAAFSADIAGHGVVEEARWARARSTAHDLGGSAGTFGHEAVSATARRIEELLWPGADLSESDRAELADLVRAARDGLRAEPDQS